MFCCTGDCLCSVGRWRLTVLFSLQTQARQASRLKPVIDKGLEQIERKIEEYQKALEETDAADEKAQRQDTGNDEILSEKIEKLKKRQEEAGTQGAHGEEGADAGIEC